jgi:hypothetical protein
VISACGKSLSHRCNGKAGSTEESPDGAFRRAAALEVRRHQLVIVIIDGEIMLQSGGCLVVESLELWFETLDSELVLWPGLGEFTGEACVSDTNFVAMSPTIVSGRGVEASLPTLFSAFLLE